MRFRELALKVTGPQARDTWKDVLPPKDHANFGVCCLFTMLITPRATDKSVVKAMANIFEAYPHDGFTAETIDHMTVDSLAKLIKPVGFHVQNAKVMKGAAAALLKDHGGKIPMNLTDLTKIKGVGPKIGGITIFETYGVSHVSTTRQFMCVEQEIDLTRHNRALLWTVILTRSSTVWVGLILHQRM